MTARVAEVTSLWKIYIQFGQKIFLRHFGLELFLLAPCINFPVFILWSYAVHSNLLVVQNTPAFCCIDIKRCFRMFQMPKEFLLRPEMKPVVIVYNLRSQCMVSVLPETGLHHESYQQVNNLVAQRYPSILWNIFSREINICAVLTARPNLSKLRGKVWPNLWH